MTITCICGVYCAMLRTPYGKREGGFIACGKSREYAIENVLIVAGLI